MEGFITRRILESARAHNGRFLLRVRHRRPEIHACKTDADLEWEAAEALVHSGRARWISPYSSMHPGIELTGPVAEQAGE